MRAVLAVSMLALCAGALSQQPSPSLAKTGKPQQSQAKGGEQAAAADQRGTEQSPAIVKLLPTPKTEAEAAQDREEREEKATLDRELVRFTGWLVVATAILAAIGSLQLVAFALQARRLRQTIDQMRKSEERQLRAYVHVDSTSVRIHPLGSHVAFEVAVNIRNFGQTPAYKIDHVATDYIEDVATHARYLEGSQRLQKIDVGPHAPFSRTFILEVDPRTAEAITDGERVFITSGKIQYRDVFGNEQTTAYKMMYKGIKGVGRPNDLRTCEDGNEAT